LIHTAEQVIFSPDAAQLKKVCANLLLVFQIFIPRNSSKKYYHETIRNVHHKHGKQMEVVFSSSVFNKLWVTTLVGTCAVPKEFESKRSPATQPYLWPWASEGGDKAPLDFENFSKKDFLSVEWEKTNFITFGPPTENFWKNPLVTPLWKKFFRRPHVWFHRNTCP